VTRSCTDPQIHAALGEAVPAPWLPRAGALAVDIVPGVAVLTTTVLAALAFPLHGRWWRLCVLLGAVAILATAVNRLAFGGQSLGRAVFGITIVHRGTCPVDPWRLLLRDLAHLLDTAPVILGWLWPLWDCRRRTFADILLRTEARLRHRSDHNLRRITGVVTLSAAALCVTGATITDTVVRHHDQQLTGASAQIAAIGPRMVEQMLSYRPETVESDFTRARVLASDDYRSELAAQQLAALKAGPVRNEYRVTNSSVLSAESGRAVMLLFLRGVRGTPPDQRYIATAVRVNFLRSGGAQWRVDHLTVVAGPRPVGATP
jgi:Mce-associated membrane protein